MVSVYRDRCHRTSVSQISDVVYREFRYDCCLGHVVIFVFDDQGDGLMSVYKFNDLKLRLMFCLFKV